MASLRRGISGGFNALGDVFDTLIRLKLQQQQQEQILNRQSELSRQEFGQRMLTDLLTNPQAAERLTANGVKLPGGIDPSIFSRTQNERLQPEIEGINKAVDLTGLPTERGLIEQARSQNIDVTPVVGKQYHSGGGPEGLLPSVSFQPEQPTTIANLLAARSEKQQALSREQAKEGQFIESVNPNGSTQKQFVSKSSLPDLQPFTTGLSTAQTIENTNQLEAGTRREKVRTAGAEAGARESATIAAQLKAAPAVLKNKIDEARAMIAVENDKTRQTAIVKAIESAKEGTAKALPRIGQLAKLWAQAAPAIKNSTLGSKAVAQIMEHVPYGTLDPKIAMYLQQRESMLPFLARLTGEVGNLADQEQVRQRYSVPTALDAVNGTGEEKLRRLQAFALAQPKIVAYLTSSQADQLNAAQRMQVVDQMVNEAMQELGGVQVGGGAAAPGSTPPPRFKVVIQ